MNALDITVTTIPSDGTGHVDIALEVLIVVTAVLAAALAIAWIAVRTGTSLRTGERVNGTPASGQSLARELPSERIPSMAAQAPATHASPTTSAATPGQPAPAKAKPADQPTTLDPA